MPDRSRSRAERPAVVLLDALGTTVELEPPAPLLAAELGMGCDERVRAAVRAEMNHYRAHATEARDGAALAALRERCARIVATGLGRPVSVEQLMAAISFRAYADARPAIERLRASGLRIGCVSNWDCALPEVLGRVGLADLFDVIVSSAAAGAAKPAPLPFEIALERLGVSAAEALHVGDTEAEDVAGARAAGIDALLLDRGGEGDLADLGELAERLTAPEPELGS